MKDIYVAVNGSDSGEGTIDSPFRTLEKARDLASKFFSEENGASGANIFLRAGTYELESTFEILKEHTGSAKCLIHYRAYNKEEVIISGGKTLDGSKFRKVLDEEIIARLPEEARHFVLCYDLKEDGLYDYGVKKNRG
ncbi:MAG: hypothetical protein GX783_13575, partial [Clostridiales bacterium]|nr:hypothetical protein [Clostridiales bacterium]